MTSIRELLTAISSFAFAFCEAFCVCIVIAAITWFGFGFYFEPPASGYVFMPLWAVLFLIHEGNYYMRPRFSLAIT